jgi:AcrR family transcriptional regulator
MRADARRNRGRLIAAAIELILEVGGEAPLDGIARRADVGIGTLYRHFPDRQALLEAVAHHVLDESAQAAEAVLADTSTDPEALRRYMHLAVDNGLGALNLIYPLLDTPAWPARRARAETLLQAIVDHARSEGQIRRDTSATDIGFAIIRFCRPLGVGRPLVDERAIAHRHIDTYVDGLAHRDGARRPHRHPPE